VKALAVMGAADGECANAAASTPLVARRATARDWQAQLADYMVNRTGASCQRCMGKQEALVAAGECHYRRGTGKSSCRR